MSDPRYALVRACFANMEEIFPAGEPRNNEPSKQARPKGHLPQMPQMPQRDLRVFEPLPLDRDLFEERAAIIEYDGGLSRTLAEFLAEKRE